MNELSLTPEEINSHLWKKLEKFYLNRLSNHRKTVSRRMNEENTNFYRGRIDECEDFLRLNPDNEDI